MIRFFHTLIYTAPAVLLAISLHEFAHGYVSYRLGDMTPKMDGRLTLNPFRHLDLYGTLCLLVFHVGWAKPIRVNVRSYKDPKKGMIMVAAAGPIMNFISAFLFLFLYGSFLRYGTDTLLTNYLTYFCYYAAVLNVGLGVFNLIPIPPLDGSNILVELVPSVEMFYRKIQKYRFLILAGLLWTGVLSGPIRILDQAILNGMWDLVKGILKIGIRTGGGTVI